MKFLNLNNFNVDLQHKLYITKETNMQQQWFKWNHAEHLQNQLCYFCWQQRKKEYLLTVKAVAFRIAVYFTFGCCVVVFYTTLQDLHACFTLFENCKWRLIVSQKLLVRIQFFHQCTGRVLPMYLQYAVDQARGFETAFSIKHNGQLNLIHIEIREGVVFVTDIVAVCWYYKVQIMCGISFAQFLVLKIFSTFVYFQS